MSRWMRRSPSFKQPARSNLWRCGFKVRCLSSTGTESHVKAEISAGQAFQKALFSLTETYQLISKLFDTAIENGVSTV